MQTIKFRIDKSEFNNNKRVWIYKYNDGELVNPLYGVEVDEIKKFGAKTTTLLLILAPQFFTSALMQWKINKKK